MYDPRSIAYASQFDIIGKWYESLYLILDEASQNAKDHIISFPELRKMASRSSSVSGFDFSDRSIAIYVQLFKSPKFLKHLQLIEFLLVHYAMQPDEDMEYSTVIKE